MKQSNKLHKELQELDKLMKNRLLLEKKKLQPSKAEKGSSQKHYERTEYSF